ncbi:MAG TPA: MBL fold metallo-hydrolase [Candidatus Limiplasma sp.]|nr:MBL fold metallo-hydrolase [Candidatus Limiplasma sp.]
MNNSIQITPVNDSLWRFTQQQFVNGHQHSVDAYLICGTQRALVIDTLDTVTGLYETVRSLTGLPLDVVITHGHGDHIGASTKAFADAGCKIYMDMRDYPLLVSAFHSDVQESWLTPLSQGDTFPLGGYCFETIALPGHSIGSIALFDPKNNLVFSGDSIGSGSFWMQGSSSRPLAEFAMHLEFFYQRIESMRLDDIMVYTGHYYQSPVQLTGQYIKDIRTLVKRILSGVIVGKEKNFSAFGHDFKCLSASYGMMREFLYDPDKFYSMGPDSAEELLKKRFTKHTAINGATAVQYMLFSPQAEEKQRYPLVIFLHGAGERSEDPMNALALADITALVTPQQQAKHPCFLLAPVCPPDHTWNEIPILDTIVKEIYMISMKQQQPVDMQRIYITGLSMGGMGTWKAISRYPALFAAAMPICGAADPMEIRNAKFTPVWAFHAQDDPVVNVAEYQTALGMDDLCGTKTLVASLRGVGNQNVHYTEYKKGELPKTWHVHPHCAWVPAYADTQARDWMFAQSKATRYDVEWLMPGVWHIEDGTDSSFYLVEGKEKALVIDTGMGQGDIIRLIRSLTSLPVELAVTHVHGDHMYHADRFGKFYMGKRDIPLLDGFLRTMMPHSKTTADDVIPVEQGSTIDLGGDIQIEVFEVGGHSPGSVAYVDRYHRLIFIGDALGVWMQVPGSLPIPEYLTSLRSFAAFLQKPENRDLVHLPGHRRQEDGIRYTNHYISNGIQRVQDMIELCEKLINDDIDAAPFTLGINFGKPAYTAKWKSASIVWNDDALPIDRRNS